MNKKNLVLSFTFALLTLFVGCTKKDKTESFDHLSGTYKIQKIELGAMNVFQDATDVLLESDCEKSLKLEFSENKVKYIAEPGCEEYESEEIVLVSGKNISSENMFFTGTITTNNSSQLVIEGNYEQAQFRLTLTKL